MKLFDRIEVVRGNVITTRADLLVLKNADQFHGADAEIASIIGYWDPVPAGETVFVPGKGISAKEVAFLGVGRLYDFRYAEIRAFAKRTVELVRDERPDASVIATTMHGPDYGLDEREAFVAQLAGYLSAVAAVSFDRLLVVEQDAQRADRLKDILQTFRDSSDFLTTTTGMLIAKGYDWLLPALQGRTSDDLGSDDGAVGPEPGPAEPSEALPQLEEKPKLFVAMPFSDDHRDEYDIAFVESAHAHGFICERLDMQSFVGDVTDEIAKRIRTSCGIIALLNDANPNVFFEVGYAMALDKPIIFVARAGQAIPFDVRNQRRVTYNRIAELRDALRGLIGDLKAAGTLT